MRVKKFGILTFLLLFLVQTGFAQEKIVSGTVIDNNGVPIAGANIIINGTARGTTTDFDGKYTINVAEGQTLVFTSVGYNEQKITVKTSNTIDVTLMEGVALDEVFVVAYGTATKESYTGSADVIKASDLQLAQNTSFQDALVGKAPGVQITKGSGQVGSATSIQIRGVGSINASTEPLYVIDGVPVASDNSGQLQGYIYTSNNVLNSLNPEDIESISILKDAAASSLYGSRAANGVVLITTKKGKTGEPKISLKTSIGFSPSWATDNWEPASTEDNLDYLYRVYYDAELSGGGTAVQSNAYALRSLNNRFGKYGYIFATNGTGPGENLVITGKTDGVLNREGQFYNWQDEFFRNAVNLTNDVAVSGGTDKTTYFSSFSYTRNDGRVKENNYDRFSGRVNVIQKIGNFIEFGSNVNVSGSTLTGFNDTNNAGANYFQAVRSRLFGVYWPTDYKTGQTYTGRYGNSFAYNNLFHDNEWENFSKVFQTRIIETVKVNILPELTAQTIFSYDNSETKDHLYYSRLHYNGKGLGEVNEMSTNEKRAVSSTTLVYDKSFGVHNFNALVGFETERNRTTFQRSTGTDLPASGLHTVSTAGDTDAAAHAWGNSMMSYLSKLEYNYNRKYHLAGSLRRDGSSKLGPNSRWGNFWSVSGAWSIDKEPFMENIETISSLRIRASYGINGTLPPSNYGWRSLIGYSAKYMSLPGSELTNISDPNLSWETNSISDVALEFGLFKNRLYGTIEYFNRDSNDLLQSVPISRVTGFSSTLRNIGSINNHGIELQLGGKIIDSKDFVWSASANASFVKSTVKTLNEGADIRWYDNVDKRAQYIYREGESTLAFYGYEYAGVDRTNGVNMFYVNDPASATAGDFLLNGRGATYDFNKANETIIGDAFPDVQGGFNTQVAYKGVSLGLNFIYKIGGYLYDSVDQQVADDGLYWERMRSQYAVDNMWTEENPNGSLPKVRGTDEEGVTQYSSRHLYDATFLRLKNINLGYDFPSSVTEKMKLSSLRVFAVGTNLFTSSKYKYADPEVNQFATKGWELPFAKNYTFGIELSF
ncbi:TonB-dependent receptor [Gelidibacter sp.]|uniref:SusC/RagA family TonB-linked outer membrane protein n=1 Tax=Gelidibacter sp. TaxID=2018083 RepID=UPI003262D17D